MRRKKETNDAQRLKQLSNLIQHTEIAGPDGTSIFDESFRRRLGDMFEQFTSILENRNTLLSRLRQARTDEFRERDKLIQMVRNAWNTVLYRVKGKAMPRSQTSLYGLSVDGRRPGKGDTPDWINRARAVIAGDQEAETNGYPPISDPDRESLQQQIDAARSHQIGAETASRALNELRTNLATIRRETHHLIREAVFAMTNAYRNESPIAKRNAMRTLGFRFGNLPGYEDEPEAIIDQAS